MPETTPLRGSPTAALIVVTFAIFTDILIYGMVVPILPRYATTLGISPTGIGVLFGSYAAALLIATPFCGWLSDRIGRRGPMMWGMFGLAAATLLFALSDTYALLLLARVLQGVAAAATWTAGLALLADTFPPDTRGRAMGTAMTGTAIGMLFGPAFGGFLYEWGGYQLPFLIAAGFALLDGLARAWLIRDPPRQTGPRVTLLMLLRDRRVLVTSGVIVVATGALTMLEPLLPLYLEQDRGISPGMIGVLFGVVSLAFALISPLAGGAADRWGRQPVMLAGLVALGLILPLLALPQTLIWIAVVLFLLGGVNALAISPSLPELADAVDAHGGHAYAMVYAIFNAAYAGGMMVGPVAGGVLFSTFNLGVTLLLTGIVMLVYAGVVLVSLARHGKL